MRIHNEHQEAQVQGVSSNSFGFEMNAKMYDILISKMYTNKQGAVVRELSANAWDAHVEAGNSDTPFDLHLPTWLDKSFYIRDYGTGIPHDKFEHIYTNVGASTKEDSDDLIGGFGLGSKTPFTMTDTFMVENHYNGIKTTWICFKDKGEPQVSKVADEETNEPSGLKVSFSFDEGDVPEFTKQVIKQLRFFPVKPTITGGEGDVVFPELPDGWENQEYFYTNKGNTHYSSNNYLVMGNVAYDLNAGEFDYSMRSFFQKGLTIKAPIGSVDVPPSRENLEMTPRTKDYINKVLTKIKDEYSDDIQTKINSCANKWELHKVIYDINFSILGDNSDITWNGEDIPWYDYRKSFISYIGGYSLRGISRRYKNVYRAQQIRLDQVIAGTIKYYVNDLGLGYSKHINNTYNTVTDVGDMCIIHLTDVNKKNIKEKVKEAMDTVEDTTGIKPMLLSSVFGFPPAPVKTKGTVGKSDPNQVFKFPDSPNNYNSLGSQLEEQTGDLPKDGYYVELKNWQLITSITHLRAVLAEGLISFLDKPLYAVRSKTIPKLDKSMHKLTQTKLETLKSTLIAEYTQYQYVKNVDNVLYNLPKHLDIILPALKDKRLITYLRYASYFYKYSKRENKGVDVLYYYIFGDTIEPEGNVDAPYKLINLSKEYAPVDELLSALTYSYDKEGNERRLKTMLNLITQ